MSQKRSKRVQSPLEDSKLTDSHCSRNVKLPLSVLRSENNIFSGVFTSKSSKRNEDSSIFNNKDLRTTYNSFVTQLFDSHKDKQGSISAYGKMRFELADSRPFSPCSALTPHYSKEREKVLEMMSSKEITKARERLWSDLHDEMLRITSLNNSIPEQHCVIENQDSLNVKKPFSKKKKAKADTDDDIPPVVSIQPESKNKFIYHKIHIEVKKKDKK